MPGLTTLARKGLGALAGRRGYALTEERDLDDAAHRRFLVSLLHEIRPDFVLDVGANEGQFRRWLREEVGYEGSGVSFEPIPDVAAKLREASGDDATWRVHEVALGEEEGVASLNVMPGKGDLSSFLSPDSSRTTVLSHLNRVERTIDVRMETLAAHIPEDATTFLKVDTQGWDLNVLKGAGGALQRVALIQTELSFTPIYAEQPTACAVIDFLQAKGFTLAGVYRNNLVGYPRRMPEADGYFVREDLAP